VRSDEIHQLKKTIGFPHAEDQLILNIKAV